MKYSAEELEAAAAKLRQLPPITNAKTHTKADAVQTLAGEIRQLKERGYTMEQIAEALRDAGIDIATTTLRNYLQRSNKPGRKRPARRDSPRPQPPAAKPQTPSAGSFTAPADTDDI